MAEVEIVKINCILDGETAKKFLKIKELKGIKQNTEAVRLTVNEFYKTIVKDSS